VNPPFVVLDAPPPECATVREQFSEIELAHALRANAAQQLRVVAAAHACDGRRAVHTAELEQAIADRIERIVEERRIAAARARARGGTTPSGVRDELAVRREQRSRDHGGRARV